MNPVKKIIEAVLGIFILIILGKALVPVLVETTGGSAFVFILALIIMGIGIVASVIALFIRGVRR